MYTFFRSYDELWKYHAGKEISQRPSQQSLQPLSMTIVNVERAARMCRRYASSVKAPGRWHECWTSCSTKDRTRKKNNNNRKQSSSTATAMNRWWWIASSSQQRPCHHVHQHDFCFNTERPKNVSPRNETTSASICELIKWFSFTTKLSANQTWANHAGMGCQKQISRHRASIMAEKR